MSLASSLGKKFRTEKRFFQSTTCSKKNCIYIHVTLARYMVNYFKTSEMPPPDMWVSPTAPSGISLGATH